jgi:hypothetical protein
MVDKNNVGSTVVAAVDDKIVRVAFRYREKVDEYHLGECQVSFCIRGCDLLETCLQQAEVS